MQIAWSIPQLPTSDLIGALALPSRNWSVSAHAGAFGQMPTARPCATRGLRLPRSISRFMEHKIASFARPGPAPGPRQGQDQGMHRAPSCLRNPRWTRLCTHWLLPGVRYIGFEGHAGHGAASVCGSPCTTDLRNPVRSLARQTQPNLIASFLSFSSGQSVRRCISILPGNRRGLPTLMASARGRGTAPVPKPARCRARHARDRRVRTAP